ncbi:putative polysaccharide biosynthesis protein [Enterococcus timonensis]|uniref:putative polysaccharide biosynthesis protein n=1 Tax=Enterococcus timonensis TaxID=1852364 RepID=UPI0008DA4567|nr:polysaccharide biosynthesis protein [Enterococcus timonensis]
MAKNEMQEMLRAAAILSAASLLVKILSAVYRVPYQNLVGDVGFYVYQQVYPFYGLAMTLSLTSLPVFLSKITQEEPDLAKKQKLLDQLFPLIFYVSLFLFASIFLSSTLLARAMGDVQLAGSIRTVSFLFLLTPALSFLRGNFQGIPWMTPTAKSQIAEQSLRVFVIIGAALLFRQGFGSVYQTASIGFFGGLLGGVLALIILLHENQRMTHFRFHLAAKFWILPSLKEIKPLLHRLTIEGGLIFIYSGLLLLYQLVDSFTVKSGLISSGLSDEAAKVAKGIFDRGQPFVQLGLVVGLALSSIFLPMLTRAFSQHQDSKFKQYTLMFLRLTATIAAASSVGLMLLMPWLNFALFKDQAGLVPLTIFMAGIFLLSVAQALVNVLQSQNKYRLALKSALLGLAFKLGTTYFLTQMFGTTGASLSTVLGLLVMNLYLLPQTGVVKHFYRPNYFAWKLLESLLWMSGALFIFRVIFADFALQSRTNALLLSVVGVFLGIVVFLKMAVSFQLLTVREWLLIPHGKYLWRFFSGRH